MTTADFIDHISHARYRCTSFDECIEGDTIATRGITQTEQLAFRDPLQNGRLGQIKCLGGIVCAQQNDAGINTRPIAGFDQINRTYLKRYFRQSKITAFPPIVLRDHLRRGDGLGVQPAAP